MKKLIALISATALAFTCFTGCGSNKEKTADELNVMADSLYRAGNSAMTEICKDFEESDFELGGKAASLKCEFWYDSNGNCDYEDFEFADDLSKKISKEWKDSEDVEWIVFFYNGEVTEAYAANSFDSVIIGTRGATDTEGKTLDSIKTEYNLERYASTLYKAVNSALTELDEEGIDIGGTFLFDSDKKIYGNEDISTEDFYNKIEGFWSDAGLYKWFVVCERGSVYSAFVSDSIDSKAIGIYPKNDTTDDVCKDETFNDVKKIFKKLIEEVR